MNKGESKLAELIGEDQVKYILDNNRCHVLYYKTKDYHTVQIQFIQDDGTDTISYCDIDYSYLDKTWRAFGHCVEIGMEDDELGLSTFEELKTEMGKIENEWWEDNSRPVKI